MNKRMIVMMTVVLCAALAQADVFGTGADEFTIDFVTILGDASSANGTNISQYYPSPYYILFSDPGDDYRMATFEITNDQWDKFTASLGVPVTGVPSSAYDTSAYWGGTNSPTDMVSWCEAAQFVNWLNTNTGHQAAYKFTGTQGTSDYTLGTWTAAEADGGTNLFRHKDALYFLPTEDEWVKAAYWNGTALQTWATTDDAAPVAGVDSNYHGVVGRPWAVGSGSEELNGTFDMMGNAWEWMEGGSPGDYGYSSRALRGGSWPESGTRTTSSYREGGFEVYSEWYAVGFRVASEVPEPCSLGLLSLGGVALVRKRRR